MAMTGDDILRNADTFRAAGLTDIELARFWSKVNKDGPTPAHRPELGPCWVWTAGCMSGKFKYGLIRIRGRNTAAHRLSYEVHVGSIPVGLRVLHHCDNPPCVRPVHLFVGTARDNTRDMMQKGRGTYVARRGAENGYSKLTEAQVRRIFAMRAEGIAEPALAQSFGCSTSQISAILRRKAWGHLTGLPEVVVGSPSPQPCGTVAAYHRHHRHGEKPCQACRDAYNASRRAQPKRSEPYERPEVECRCCGQMKPHSGHGLCGTCYSRWRHEGFAGSGPSSPQVTASAEKARLHETAITRLPTRRAAEQLGVTVRTVQRWRRTLGEAS